MVFPAAAAAMAIPAVTGMIGEARSRGDRHNANAFSRKALEELSNVDVPEYQYLERLNLDDYDQISQIVPQHERGVMADETAMSSISLDPTLRARQMDALSQLGDVAQGGFTLSDRAALEAAQSDINAQERGARDAIMQNMQARGMSGSGMELLAQLQGQQAAASQAHSAGLEQAGMAQRRALDAMAQQGQMAGQMRGQDFGQAAQVAQARDAMNQFNTRNQIGTQQRNVDRTNQAAMQNQALQQAQVDKRNQNRVFDEFDRVQANNQQKGQKFGQQMDKASGIAGQYRGMSARSDASADREQAKWAQMGQGLGKMAGAFGGS